MKIEDQLSFLRRRLAEPVNADDARWTPDELLQALNEGREWFAEESKSFQIRDSQQTNPGGIATKFYKVKNDVILFYAVEYDGIPLTPVKPRDWRETVGINDDLTGIPHVYKYFLRQLQIFFVPQDQRTLRFEGYGYPTILPGITGDDVEFTDQQARGGIYRAAWQLKDDDERDSTKEERASREIARQFLDQYRPRGPRTVRTTTSVNPIIGLFKGF